MMGRGMPRVEFGRADDLFGARGNELRRSPAAQSQFTRDLMSDPQGMHDPAIIIADPDTGRFMVGEGNHRLVAAMEAGEPLPMTVQIGEVPAHMGQRMSSQGISNLRSVSPGELTPSHLGINVYDPQTLQTFATDRMIRTGVSSEDMDRTLGHLQEHLPRASGPTVGEAPPASYWPSHTLDRAVDEMGQTLGFFRTNPQFLPNLSEYSGIPVDVLMEMLEIGLGGQ